MTRLVLRVTLDADSQRRLAPLARHPVLRADHVTLVFGLAPEQLLPTSLPANLGVGDRVALRAVSEAWDERVQTLVVEIEGSSRRPHDGGVLHVTVSRAIGARSSDSNLLLEQTSGEPRDIELAGFVQWSEYAHDDTR